MLTTSPSGFPSVIDCLKRRLRIERSWLGPAGASRYVGDCCWPSRQPGRTIPSMGWRYRAIEGVSARGVAA